MTFTNEERTVLGEIERVFGPVAEPNPLQIEPLFVESYRQNVRNYIRWAVDHFKAYELASDPELPAIKKRLTEERRKADMEKNAARTVEKRENHVTSILAGLAGKARVAGTVTFEANENYIGLTVENGDREIFIELTYERKTGLLHGFLLTEEFTPEDWTVLNGNARPVDQSGALAEVHDYLDGLAAEDA